MKKPFRIQRNGICKRIKYLKTEGLLLEDPLSFDILYRIFYSFKSQFNNFIKRRIFMGEGEKFYVLDASVLLHDPEALLSFEGNSLVVPISVIDKLDSFKKSTDSEGFNSRKILHLLGEFSSNGDNPREGLNLPNGGKLYIDDHKGDIFSVIEKWKGSGKKVIFVTKSPALRIKAKIRGFFAEDYKTDKMISSIEEMYTGTKTIELSNSFGESFFEKIYRDGGIEVAELEDPSFVKELLLNQCCTFFHNNGSGRKTVLALYKGNNFKLVGKPKKEGEKRKVAPLNNEQAFAYALLKDPGVLITTLVGDGGTGKTLMALAAGYEQLGTAFKRIEIYRPNYELGQELGFLPGTVEKKFAPWTKPISDNFELIVNGGIDGKKHEKQKLGKRDLSTLAMMMEDGQISIEPINYLQGRTIHETFIIVDEIQNFTPSQTKIVLARAGDGSKIVLTGDVKQRANPYVDEISNGLVYTVEKLKGREGFGHVILKDASVRSRIAQLVSEAM